MSDHFIPSREALLLAAKDCISMSSCTERLVFGDGRQEPFWEPQERTGGGNRASLRRMARRGIRSFNCAVTAQGHWDWIVKFRCPSCWSTTYGLITAHPPEHYEAIVRARAERKELEATSREGASPRRSLKASTRL